MAIRAKLMTALRKQFAGRDSFVAEQTMRGVRSCIARTALIASGNATTGPPQYKRRAQSGRAATHNNYVV